MMAEEEETSTPMELDSKLPSSSDSESDAGRGDEGADGQQPAVEMLVTGRAKRSTAGNRMSTMIGEIAADDDLELLFAEDDEAGPDEEFEESDFGGASDNDLGDSSDDEDQGPAAAGGAEDLEGEKEIERQAREDRKRKRKAERAAFTKPSKKKTKVPPFMATTSAKSTASSPADATASKPKKKIDRSTWAPSLNEGVRTSRREATTLQTEALRTRIVAREKDRKEQMKRLEEKARRREANKPRALTQEDRLREAAEVEQENSKSLNRWEAIENERREEERRRLEALQNRQLKGPVISYWSGAARWIGDKLTAVGIDKIKRAEEKKADNEAVPDKEKDKKTDNAEDEMALDTEEPSQQEKGAEAEGAKSAKDQNNKQRLDQEEPSKPVPADGAKPPENQTEAQNRPKSPAPNKDVPQTALPTITAPASEDSTAQNPQEAARQAAPAASPHPPLRPSAEQETPSQAPSLSPQPSLLPLSSEVASPQPEAQPQHKDSAPATTRSGSEVQTLEVPSASADTPRPSNPPSISDQVIASTESSTPQVTQSAATDESQAKPSPAPTEAPRQIKQEPSHTTSMPSASTTTFQKGGAQQIVFSIHTPQKSPGSVSSTLNPTAGPQPQASLPSNLTNSQQQLTTPSNASTPAPTHPSTTGDSAHTTPAAQPPGPPPPPPKPVVAARNLITVLNVDLTSVPSTNPALAAPPPSISETLSPIPKPLRGSILLASSKPVKTRGRGRAAANAENSNAAHGNEKSGRGGGAAGASSGSAGPQQTCTVTGLQVRYRDPRTGLGYANPYAYRQLSAVRGGRLMWNEITRTYAGPAPKVPEGLPPEFLKAMAGETPVFAPRPAPAAEGDKGGEQAGEGVAAQGENGEAKPAEKAAV